MHLHDYTEETYFVAPAPDGTMAPPSLAEFQKQMKEIMQQYNVVKGVISTIGGPNVMENEEVFIPGMYTNQPPQDTTGFRKQIESGQIKVFGEIGAVYGGYTLSDPEFEPYLKLCEQYDIPVAVHTGGGPSGIAYRCCPQFRITLGDPFTIEDVLVKHPKLRIYMMHAGEVFYEHALRLMTQYRQVYADLGVLLWVHEQPMDYAEQFLRKAKKYGLLDRVMYGTDQMVWPHAIEKSILKLDEYDFLSEKEKRMIFYENAVRFLRLQ
ncbi:MAG: amidohydrolase family protein [Cyclobacteriaceae bacterium]|nr:amidohydrolase family protein [Cyclobacteriaceae bacterium SS2]